MEFVTGIVFAFAFSLVILMPLLFFKIGNKSFYIAGGILLAFIVASIIGKDISIMLQLSAPLVIGMIAGYSLVNGKDVQFYILISTVMLSVLMTSTYIYNVKVNNIDIMKMYEQMNENLISANLSPEQMLEMKKVSGVYFSFMSYNIYFVMFFQSLLWSVISFFMIRLAFLRTISVRKISIKGLEFFKLNEYFVFIIIAALAAVALLDKKDNAMLYQYAVNGLLIGGLLYLIQAFGVIKFYMKKFRIPGFFLLLSLFILMTTGLQIFTVSAAMIAGVGLLDEWADFRKFNTTEEKSSE